MDLISQVPVAESPVPGEQAFGLVVQVVMSHTAVLELLFQLQPLAQLLMNADPGVQGARSWAPTTLAGDPHEAPGSWPWPWLILSHFWHLGSEPGSRILSIFFLKTKIRHFLGFV